MLHQGLTQEKWQKLSFLAQMGNVGSEIGRTINWLPKNQAQGQAAFDRGLELLDLTLVDPKNRKRLKELCRLRECLADYFYGDNEFGSTDASWEQYFYGFTYAAALERGA